MAAELGGLKAGSGRPLEAEWPGRRFRGVAECQNNDFVLSETWPGVRSEQDLV